MEYLRDSSGEVIGALGYLVHSVGLACYAASVWISRLGDGGSAVFLIAEEFFDCD